MKTVSPKSGNLSIDQHCLKIASGIFRAADHPLRQKILLFIHQNLRVNVRTIYKKLKIEQSVASHHLGNFVKQSWFYPCVMVSIFFTVLIMKN